MRDAQNDKNWVLIVKKQNKFCLKKKHFFLINYIWGFFTYFQNKWYYSQKISHNSWKSNNFK